MKYFNSAAVLFMLAGGAAYAMHNGYVACSGWLVFALFICCFRIVE